MCNYSEEQLDRIWEKGIAVDGFPKEQVRKDVCGAWMLRQFYNDNTTIYGWVVDHIIPVSKLQAKGKTKDEIDNETNLRPMNYRNDMSKGSDYPVYESSVTSSNNFNIERKEERTVSKAIQDKLKELYHL